jgi:hypothetical protein
MGPLIGLDILESALAVANRIKFVAGNAAMSSSLHAIPPMKKIKR